MATNSINIKFALIGLGAVKAGLLQAGQSAKGVAGAFGGLRSIAAGIAGLGGVAAIRHLAEEMDNAGKASQKLGVATEVLTGLQYAAKLAGVEVQEFNKGLVLFSKTIAAASGDSSSEAARVFSSIGVSVHEANGVLKSTDKILLEVAQSFSQYEDGALKTTAATVLFGRAGADMIPLLNGGAAGIQEMAEKAALLGLTFSSETAKEAEIVNDNLTTLGAVVSGLGIKVVTELLPTLVAATNALTTLAANGETTRSIIDFLRQSVAGLVLVLRTVYELFQLVGIFLGTAFAIAVRNVEAYVNVAVKTFTNLASALLLVWERLKASVALLGQFGNVLKLVMQRDFQGAFDESKRIMAEVGANSLVIMAALPVAMAKSVGDAWDESKATASDYLSYIKTGWETAKRSVEKYQLAASAIIDIGTGKGAVAGLPAPGKSGVSNKPFPAFNTSVDTTAEELRFKRELLAIDIRRSEVNGNFRLSEAEKYRANLALLRDELLLLQERDAFLQNAASRETDPKKKNALVSKIDANSGDIGKKEASISALGPSPDSFFDQLESKVVSLQDSFGTMNQAFAGAMASGIQNVIQGMSNALTGLIMGTKSAAQAFREFGLSVISTFIQQIVSAILWAKVALPILTALGVVSGGTTAATGAGVTIAMTSMAVAAVGSMAGVMAAEGGLVTGPGTGTSDSIRAWLSNGEFVIPARATAALGRDNLEMLRAGQLPAVAVPSSGGSNAAAAPQIHQTLLLALDPARLAQLQREHTEAIVVDVLKRHLA